MPKLKTRKSAAKRFRVTKSGKIKFAKANRRHLLTRKGPNRKRQLRVPGVLTSADQARVKALLPYA